MKIKVVNTFKHVHKPKLQDLIQAAFNAELAPDYFTYARPAKIGIIQEDDKYAGAFILESVPSIKQGYYLDKIARHPDFKGHGLGNLLWYHITSNAPKLVWRSALENDCSDFYGGKYSRKVTPPGQYEYFMYGMSEQEQQLALKYAKSKKPTITRLSQSSL